MGQKRKGVPCVLYELQDYNKPEYQQGFRFRLHDLDDDQAFFTTRERMQQPRRDPRVSAGDVQDNGETPGQGCGWLIEGGVAMGMILEAGQRRPA